MQNLKRIKHVESNANIILTILRENPKLSSRKLYEIVYAQNNDITPMTLSMFRKYLNALYIYNYLKKTGIHTKIYTVICEKTFVYPDDKKDILRS